MEALVQDYGTAVVPDINELAQETKNANLQSESIPILQNGQEEDEAVKPGTSNPDNPQTLTHNFMVNQCVVQRDPENFYNSWYENYEHDMLSQGYNGPDQTAALARKYFGANENGEIVLEFDWLNIQHQPISEQQNVKSYVKDFTAVRILDVCAGTGLISRRLNGHFANLDALDGSENMLRRAKAANLYNQYIHSLVDPENPTPIADSTYDGAFCSAAVCPGHLNPTHFPEIFRVLKHGGIFIIVMNKNFARPIPSGERHYPYDVIGELYRMEREGMIKLILHEDQPYFEEVMGVHFAMRVLKY